MKQILLTQFKVALVDDEDFEELNQFNWCAAKMKNAFYALRSYRCLSDGKQHNIYMHRQLTNTSSGMDTDHINGNSLDNRRSNLRVCTRQQNNQNRQKDLKKSSSGFKGICWRKSDKKWIARIKPNGKRIFLGSFDDEVEAAKAYDTKAIELFGEFACLNFKNRKAG